MDQQFNNKHKVGAVLAATVLVGGLAVLLMREDVSSVVAHDTTPEAAYFSDAAILTQWPAKKHRHQLKMAPHELGTVGSRDSTTDDLLQIVPDTVVEEDGARTLREVEEALKARHAEELQMAAVLQEASRIEAGAAGDEGDASEDPPWTDEDSAPSTAVLTETGGSDPRSAQKPSKSVALTAQAHTVQAPKAPPVLSKTAAKSAAVKPAAPQHRALRAAKEISAKAEAAETAAAALQARAKHAWSEVPAQDTPAAQLVDIDNLKDPPPLTEPYNAPAPSPAQSPPMKMERDSYDPTLWHAQAVQPREDDDLFSKEVEEKAQALSYEKTQKQVFQEHEQAINRRAAEQKMEEARAASEEKADKAREVVAARQAAAQAAEAQKQRTASLQAWHQKLADAEAVGRERGNKVADAKQAQIEHEHLQEARQQQAERLDKAAAKERVRQTAKIQEVAAVTEDHRLQKYRRKAEELVDKAVSKGKKGTAWSA